MPQHFIEGVISPKIIRIGGGAVNETGEILEQLGLSSPLIVTDKTLVALGHVSQLTDILKDFKVKWTIFDQVIPEPTDICLAHGLQTFKSESFDCIIGFGGGSCLDLAKAISAMSVNSGHIRNYKQPKQINRPGVPIILIPTTGGTGSELTKWCVISDTKFHEKYNLSGLGLVATAAIIDWKFSKTKPPRITADTAIDSLTHAIEAFVSKKANNFSDELALKSIPLISNNIEKAYYFPGNPTAREALMRGAALAGMAFSNSSVALVHGMSRPIGSHFHLSHGLSNAMLLAEVTSFSIKSAERRYAECAVAAGWAKPSESKSEACKKLIIKLQQLKSNLKVPSPKTLGIDKNTYFRTLPVMAQQALESGSPQNNPRVPSTKNILQLYKAIW